jgi:hypothetical protein
MRRSLRRGACAGCCCSGLWRAARRTPLRTVVVAADLAPDHSLSLLDFARIERELAEEIGRRVDFVSVSGLKPEVRARVEREAIRAF